MWHPVRPHGRPFAGAFNVVLATGIISTGARLEGLDGLSDALLWLTVLAFAALAALDLRAARHPLGMLHEAGDPVHGFAALGFVADTAVLGSRIVRDGDAARWIAAVLGVAGVAVWVVLAVALLRSRAGGSVRRARGEWLLATVASEGLAILGALLVRTGAPGEVLGAAVALWLLGGVAYLVILGALVARVRRHGLRPQDLTPDWWIVMGAPAIFALAGATILHAGPAAGAEAIRAAAEAGWGVATLLLLPVLAGEAWRWTRLGPPRFTPQRWTMVFPLGVYAVASDELAAASAADWMLEVGRIAFGVAVLAWATVAGGEVRHAVLPEGGELGQGTARQQPRDA